MSARTVIAVAALALATSTAYAGEPYPTEQIPEKARSLAEKGRAYHQAGDYGNAIVAFKEAYVMAPSPGLLFNLAQAYRLQGNCDDAELMYRRYLNTDPSPEAQAIAEGHLHSVERCVHKRGLNIATVEEHPAGALQPPAPNGTLYREPERGGGPDLKKNIGIGLAIGGGIALAAATYYMFDARSASNKVENLYASGAKWKDIEALDQRGERSAKLSTIPGIGGGLTVAAGVTVYFIGRHEERLAPLALLPTKHGAQVSYAWRF